MINGEGTRGSSSEVASPDPLDEFLPWKSSKSDGADASPVSSRYSSCGESEFERYCSANSVMGTPSLCSSIGTFHECPDSEFGSLMSFRLGDSCDLENFALGGKFDAKHEDTKLLSSVERGCLSRSEVSDGKSDVGLKNNVELGQGLVNIKNGLNVYDITESTSSSCGVNHVDARAMVPLNGGERLNLPSFSELNSALDEGLYDEDDLGGILTWRESGVVRFSSETDCAKDTANQEALEENMLNLAVGDGLHIFSGEREDFESHSCIEQVDDGSKGSTLKLGLEFHRKMDGRFSDEDATSSRYEHSEGEDSMIGCGTDDERRLNVYHSGNTRHPLKSNGENESSLLMTSSIAFGAEDWDDFMQEAGESTLASIVLDNVQRHEQQIVEIERDYLNSTSQFVSRPPSKDVLEQPGDVGDIPIASNYVQRGDESVDYIKTCPTESVDVLRVEVEQTEDVKNVLVTSSPAANVHEPTENVETSSSGKVIEAKDPLTEEAPFQVRYNELRSENQCTSTKENTGVTDGHQRASIKEATGVTDGHQFISIKKAAGVTDRHQCKSIKEATGVTDGHQFISIKEAADVTDRHPCTSIKEAIGVTDGHQCTSIKEAIGVTDGHQCTSIKEATGISNGDSSGCMGLEKTDFPMNPFSDNTINHHFSAPGLATETKMEEFLEGYKSYLLPSFVNTDRKETMKDTTFSFNSECCHAPIKTQNFELNEFYNEVVHEMEEILLDSSGSSAARFTNSNSLSQMPLPLRDGGSTASTSGTDNTCPLVQLHQRIDHVEVVGARQKKGDVSLGKRLVGVKEYTVYNIRVWCGEDHWEVERRYREFYTLYQKLKTLFADQGLCLPSPWTSVEQESRKLFGSTSPDGIAERSLLIQECLQSVLHFGFLSTSSSALLLFLSPPKATPALFSTRSKDMDSVSTLGKTISLIVDIQPYKSTKQILEAQHYNCAGCHKHLDDEKTRMREFVQTLGWGKPRLCEYTGQLFCSSCHTNETAVLPSRVLHFWDFSHYPVSQMAKSYLDSIYDQPMLCVSAVNPFLFSKVPALQHVRSVRRKICAMIPYVHCPFRRSIYRGLGPRRYLLEGNEFFALKDLVDLSKGVFAALPVMIETISRKILDHITEQCLICCDVGVPCNARQACADPSSLIFPFQEEEIERCRSCESVFHKPCFRKIVNCPCATAFKSDKLMGGTTQGSTGVSSEVGGTLDLLGRVVDSRSPLGLFSGLLSKMRPGKLQGTRDSDTVILMGSLPSTSL